MTERNTEEGATESPELKVFISGRESTCGECKAELARHAWIWLGQTGTSARGMWPGSDHPDRTAGGPSMRKLSPLPWRLRSRSLSRRHACRSAPVTSGSRGFS